MQVLCFALLLCYFRWRRNRRARAMMSLLADAGVRDAM